MSSRNSKKSADDFCFGGEHLVVPSDNDASTLQNSSRGNSINTTFARGAFGEVSLAYYHDTSNDVDKASSSSCSTSLPVVCALKTLTRPWKNAAVPQNGFSQAAHAEVAALKQLAPHVNIVPLCAVSMRGGTMSGSGDSLRLALEYSPVDLAMVLEWKRRTCAPLLSIHVVQTIAHDILQALRHCHEHGGILHRDVKPGNLLVSGPTGHVKLCDFGLAYFTGETNGATNDKYDQALGTLFYRPPEILLGARAVDASVDIYAAGVTIAELTSGRALFAGTNDLQQLQLIFQGLGTPTKTSWPRVDQVPDWGKLNFAEQAAMAWDALLPRAAETPSLLRLLQGMIQLDPSQRRSSSDCLLLLVNQNHEDDDFVNAEVAKQSRQAVIRECIPIQLLPPILLSNDTVPVQRLVSLAKARRNFLGSLETRWQKE